MSRTLFHRFALILATSLASLTTTAPLPAAIFTVGPFLDCTHGTLVSALASAASNPGSDVIRLLDGSEHQGPFVVSVIDQLTVQGGYADCQASFPVGTSTLRGGSGSRAALILPNAAAISLESLHVTGGLVDGDGGGLLIQGSGFVSLRAVTVSGNEASGRGGAVFVNATAALDVYLLPGTTLEAGLATDGGGLACVGPAFVDLWDNSRIRNNEVTRDGGGAHLADGCTMQLDAGGLTGGILDNVAGRNGGGVAVGADSTFFGQASFLGESPVIRGNSAPNGSGGGVAATGSQARVGMWAARFEDNHAQFLGGAIMARDGAWVTLQGPAIGDSLLPCSTSTKCLQIRGNSAAEGGAIYAATGALAQLHGTHIEDNIASLQGSVVVTAGSAFAVIESSVIANNQGPMPLVVEATGKLTLGNVTTYHQNTGAAQGLLRIAPGAGPVRLLSSILDEPGQLLLASAPSDAVLQLDCLLGPGSTFFGALPNTTAIRAVALGDPHLANPSAGNFQLKGTSPALDFCDTTEWAGLPVDVDGQPRDTNLAITDLLGPRDLGADEYWVVFADGFESGLTTAWSTAVP